jgi:predicted KAP-like P-loop ATPase
VWGNQTYSADFMLGWDRELRICSERRFPTYFQFAPAEDVLPRSEVTALKAALLDRRAMQFCRFGLSMSAEMWAAAV